MTRMTREKAGRHAELRYNHFHDKDGKFASASSLSKRYSNGGAKPIDKASESGIMNLGYHSNGCFIEDKKVNGFYLQKGAKHSQEFFNVGYTENDGLKLQKDIASQFDLSKAYDKIEQPDQTKTLCINMQLGIGYQKTFRTVWEKKTSDTEWRNITAFDISDHIKR